MFSKILARLPLIVLAAALVGCSSLSPATPTPTLAPTEDSKATLDVLSKSVVETVFVALTQSAPTATPVTPTSTATPTVAITPTPSETAGPSATPTHPFIAWTKTPTPTQSAYACSVLDVTPRTSDKINANNTFNAVWSVKNVGLSTWNAGNTDIRYVEGEKMQTNGDAVDLSGNVAPNGTSTITVGMKAPDGDGTFNTTWGIYLEDGTVCSLNLTINVSK